MKTVNTANGPVTTDELGMTLMHEHVFLYDPDLKENYDTGWGTDEERIDEAVERLNDLKRAGIDTIVDLTVVGLGRYVPRIQKVAERTDVNIVVATGLYTFHDLPAFFELRGPGRFLGGPDLLVDMFVRDIEEGIYQTNNVKAAILKCATDRPGVTHGVRRVLDAISEAHHKTGVPITTHTHAKSEQGLDQQAVFKENGVDLGRVIIGHSGDSSDMGYLEKLIDNGSYIGMDRFGLDAYGSFETRTEMVARLCDKGYADRMVLSHDSWCFSHHFLRAEANAHYPNWHYQHVIKDVLPALRERGVSEQQIQRMMVDNPRAIFEC